MVGPRRSINPIAGLLARFEANLSPAERDALAAARAWSDRVAVPLYLVGGSVRDLLLGSPHFDLDLAADGNVIELGRELARRFSAALTVHEHFSTVALVAPRWSMDVARTRSERYAYPGALPVVEPAPIEADLGRRDFSIHAMALALTGGPAGRLLDPIGGRTDLEGGLLRVLHADSFRDDPTRILRLARYASRLRFDVEPATWQLAARDATFIRAVSGARIAHELERTFAEQRPEGALWLLDGVRALHALSRHFTLPADLDTIFERLRGAGDAPSMADYLAALAAGWDRHAIQQVIDRLELQQETVAALRACPAVDQSLRRLVAGRPDPVAVVEALAQHPPAALQGVGAARGGAAWTLVRHYVQRWRNVRPELRGDDLIALGVPYGPAVGEVLRRLRNGKLRGELRSRDQEMVAVRDWAAAATVRAEAG